MSEHATDYATPLQRRLATVFTERLAAEIGGHNMALVERLNALEPDFHGEICHSHDFCDANMVMHEAFTAVHGREPRLGHADETDTDEMRMAWDYAIEHLFAAYRADVGFVGLPANDAPPVAVPPVAEPGAPMRCREALQIAVEVLQGQASEEPDPEEEQSLRRAVKTLQAMLDQQGLEVFQNGDDGTLPNFCDVVIFG